MQCFFYHSGVKNPAIVGVCECTREAFVDPSQSDPKHPYYAEDADPDNPWLALEVKFVRELARPVSESLPLVPCVHRLGQRCCALTRALYLLQIYLHELRAFQSSKLAGMALLTRSRLSVSPVSDKEWDFILELEKTPPPEGSGKKPGKPKAGQTGTDKADDGAGPADSAADSAADSGVAKSDPSPTKGKRKRSAKDAANKDDEAGGTAQEPKQKKARTE